MADYMIPGLLFNLDLNPFTLQSPPYIQSKSSKKHLRGNDRYEGFCIDLIDSVASALGMKYHLYEAPGGVFGEERSNGAWSGAIGQLIDGVKWKYTVQCL